MEQQTEIAQDLRQTYSIIVSQHLIDVAEARKEKNYSHYFNALDDLYTIIKHKFKRKIKKGKKKVKAINKYPELKNNFIKISNKYVNAYSGKSNNPKEVFEIENSLKRIERYFYKKMDEAKMFGSKRDMQGLI